MGIMASVRDSLRYAGVVRLMMPVPMWEGGREGSLMALAAGLCIRPTRVALAPPSLGEIGIGVVRRAMYLGWECGMDYLERGRRQGSAGQVYRVAQHARESVSVT